MKKNITREQILAVVSEEEFLDLGRKLVASIAEDQIAAGELDPTGKTAAQVAIEAGRRILKRWPVGADIVTIDSHQPSLLDKARLHRRRGDFGVACLLYSTWFEHWINSMLVRSRCPLAEEEKEQMVRDAHIRGKFSWLLVVLGYPRIPSRHLNCVMLVNEIRNGFVHYKWKSKSENQAAEEKKRIAGCLKSVESTIRYLLQFEDKHQLKGSRKILSQINGKTKKKK